MILDASEMVYVCDFEYFGWDDPVKMVADFYWHPGMNLRDNQKNEWLLIAKKTFKKDPKFKERLDTMLPFYGLKWCLIILNIFKHKQSSLIADAELGIHNLDAKMSEQLRKSKNLLFKIRELYG
jgi:hypothetical protein